MRKTTRLLEVGLYFLKLGSIGFGGPAAHIAMMREEVVKRKKWLNDEQFLDLTGATNLIPGPNSTEMAIHIGYLRAGWPGLILAGTAFILPATLIVIGLSWIYVRYSRFPDAGWLLYAVKPVVIAIIIQAIWGLGKNAVKNILTGITGVIVFAGYFFLRNEILLLLGAGFLVMLFENLRNIRKSTLLSIFLPLLLLTNPTFPTIPFNIWGMFLSFLKIGSILYGSGYVLIAYLQSEFVNRLGWLTSNQIVDAITIGQITPGPVFTTATFIGYLLAGPTGAVLATMGIFLPAFIFVAISNPFIPRMRRSTWFGGFLDGINVASLGLMAAALVQIGKSTLIDWFTITICLISTILLIRFRLNPTWLIIAGMLLGLAKHLFPA